MRVALLVPALLLACRTGDKSPAGSADTGGLTIVDGDGDGFPADEDCDDDDAAIHGGAVEVCDGVDNDCDGEVDEGVADTWYVDADSDGYGDPDAPAEACSQPSGTVSSATDCDDTDPDVSPVGLEVCDGVDNDCDGAVDEDVLRSFWADGDGDGWGDPAAPTEACEAPSGFVDNDGDCDDTTAAAAPDLDEVCDGLDNDCDGDIDEPDATDAPTWYADADGDGYGDLASPTVACAAPSSTVADSTDCDDAAFDVHPGAAEVCNGIDDDCDGDIDDADSSVDTATGSTWYTDADSDGYGDAAAPVSACTQPAGTVPDATDCDDTAAAVNPAAAEVCNRIDDDCDGDIDDADSSVDTSTGSSWYVDSDGDGYGDPSATVQACAQPSASSTDNTDCDDTDATIRPDSNGECALGESCDDVLDRYPSSLDGDYVIDPDGYGTGLDPFEVSCDMTTDGGGWTEIAYSADLTFQQHFTGGDGWQWQASDFSFELSDAQIAAIQAVSAEGFQLYEGRCEHVIHYYYTSGSTYGYAFGFEFFDGTQTPRGGSSYSPYDISVTSDGCAGNGGEGGSLTQTTDFEIDSVLVPVRNVQCRDCGDTFPEYFGSVLTDNPAWLR